MDLLREEGGGSRGPTNGNRSKSASYTGKLGPPGATTSGARPQDAYQPGFVDPLPRDNPTFEPGPGMGTVTGGMRSQGVVGWRMQDTPMDESHPKQSGGERKLVEGESSGAKNGQVGGSKFKIKATEGAEPSSNSRASAGGDLTPTKLRRRLSEDMKELRIREEELEGEPSFPSVEATGGLSKNVPERTSARNQGVMKRNRRQVTGIDKEWEKHHGRCALTLRFTSATFYHREGTALSWTQARSTLQTSGIWSASGYQHRLEVVMCNIRHRPKIRGMVLGKGECKSLKELRNALDCCVCDAGWVDKMVRSDQLSAMHEPVVELLCLVDGQGATISKVYFKMDWVVQDLCALECLSEEEHEAVERILMRRWAFLTSELHCVAGFLDPEHRMHNGDRDPEVRAGFNIWLYSWMPRHRLHVVSSQVDQWVNALGGFSTEQACEQANHQLPTLWWEAFGSKHDFLVPQAIKLLGQTNSSAACERNWSLHELIYGRRRTKLLPERMAKLRGEGDDTHIPWANDVSVDKEMEEWCVRWLERVNEDVDHEEVAEVDFDDNGDEIPMRRTFVRNDEVDDRLVEEEETELVGIRQRDWHECTKPGKHREQELRRRSGCQLPEPGELYSEAGYALTMEARRAGTWVQGRDEAPRKRRGKAKGKQTVVDDDPPAQSGKRKVIQQEQPPPKRGRPTLAEQAALRAQVAEDKAVVAVAAAKVAADKAAKAKAIAAVKAATKSAGGGKAKKSVVVSDDDDLDVLKESPEEDEPERSSMSSDSSSSSAASSSQSSGREGTNGEGSEGGAQFEDDEEEDRAEAE
ncbi:hypothetical protein CBR_g3646 [Chara braunii]|uniref:HAT C-terminal dimerisation domain-containing protein n=1 Tax=Chara braunii TaxID=69332 RepID=A0A388KG14_CHABU|nr:hypothetical protein CBR_g3646 [Chara braunii]|eukprot:GBG68947.1 hypothetical protein CBR_g3646 [Chara braunii]